MKLESPSLDEIADPTLYSLDGAVSIARQLMNDGQSIPEEIANALQFDQSLDPARADRMLEMLPKIANAGRLLPLLDRIIPSSNSRIRSKCWKIFAAESGDLTWAKAQLNDPDARVAANVVEALWRLSPSEELHEIFRLAAQQKRNRIAGNGLVGLFGYGDPLAEEVVANMAASPDSSQRATVAWAIGRAYWLGGTETLQELLKDRCEKVRIHAERSLFRLRQRYPNLDWA